MARSKSKIKMKTRAQSAAIRDEIVQRLHTNPNMKFSALGREFGLTRERVRQIAKESGIKGRERSRVSRENQRYERLMKFPVMAAVVSAAQAYGLEPVTPVMARVVKINNRVCRLQRAGVWGRHHFIGLRPCTAACDFVLYWMPSGDWLVVSKQDAPLKSTMASADGGARWSRCRNAWDALK